MSVKAALSRQGTDCIHIGIFYIEYYKVKILKSILIREFLYWIGELSAQGNHLFILIGELFTQMSKLLVPIN